MTDHYQLNRLRSYVCTMELLAESLVNHDEHLENDPEPQLTFRSTAGIHQAIRIISRLASEQCGKLLERDEQGRSTGAPNTQAQRPEV
ncbi:MAG TPA: hypothetical protein VJS90_09390 [Pseudomonas sp.]|uniref:hypothetical protein n=1 Tax=Pseudomonas sp. TaxID=306 RepID=UPI002B4A7070|nr:hypothetical protein [Pseudomonas sp.]HKS13239.1 hypothetical protein [Pseudomonas sp.]